MTSTELPHYDVQSVGQAFVGWYYYYLLNFPEVIHRFYQKGTNKNTRRIREIKKKIVSRDYIGCIAEIEVVDTQESADGGLQVFVDGHITGKDGVRRRFTQTFFLLRLVENKGYFVYNDIFCYVEDSASAAQQALPLPDQEYHLWSSEGQEFKVDEEVAWMSETLRDMFEEGCEDDCTTLYGINSGTLNSVLEYCKKHCPANMGDSEEELKQWDKEFVKMEDHHLLEVIVAAKHMKVKGVIDLCEEVAERVKDLILAKMHRYLDL